MRWLLFVARVALICNLFFIVCVVLRYTDLTLSQDFKGFVIIVGYPMSVIMNAVVNIAVFACLIMRRQTGLPPWLTIFNVFCFFFQIVYFIFL
jgi:hypothetical protein